MTDTDPRLTATERGAPGLRYLDICSGISAPTMAWKPLGWQALCFAEIEAAPRAVLAHHYPDVPLVGDFTQIRGDEYGPVDLLVGGTPCQSFSVAGLRGGLADERGNLALEYLRLADRARPRWLVWENVPGVLSSNGGRDFGTFLGGLAGLGYGFAYAVLDAQHFGVPQRRRRVFVVGHLGDWRRAAAVLFERHSLSGDTPPRRETGPGVAALTANGVGTCGADDNQGQAGHLIPQGCGGEIAPTLNSEFGSKLGLDNQHIDSGAGLFVRSSITYATDGQGNAAFSDGLALSLTSHNEQPYIAHSLRAEGFDASEDGTGRGTPLVPVAEPMVLMERGRDGSPNLEYRQDGTANAILTPNGGRGGLGVGAICFTAKDHGADAGELSPTLRAGGHSGSHANAGVMPAIALQSVNCPQAKAQNGIGVSEADAMYSLTSRDLHGVQLASAVRRLTPRECERLQGFPDDFTLVPYRKGMMADGPRYKMLGNSMAVPVVRWIGERIARVDALALSEREAA